MEKPFLALFCAGFVLLDAVEGFPIEYSSLSTGEPNSLWLTSYFITAFGFLLAVIAIIFGCVCCRNGKGFKEFSNSSGSLANTRTEGFVNPTANAELTIFPPAGANAGQICRFEPLPDYKPQTPNLRPAAFSCSEREISSQDWFSEPYSNFPRNQLKYVEEYGRGWFGRVVEGEAQNILPKEKLTKVMVKILHEDATPTDQMYFLHEVKFYKDLKHPNILRLLGRCLETEPFLIILECYPNGDLKTFLSQNMASARALVEQGATLQMCSNITSGLEYMHKNKFIHTDLATRNCLVGPDLTVKIGDYGNSIENFKSDYYCAGSVALPIRWCAPETLKCTDVTIETREVTPPANVWTLAVVFWEICEFCKLPYSELNDDQVIVRVLGDKNYILDKPSMYCLYKDEMYHLMKLCWNPPLQRPTASQIQVILDNLISSGKSVAKGGQMDIKRFSQDFEQRWRNLKPNHIPKTDNAGDGDAQGAGCMGISMLKNAKVVDSSLVDSPLGLFMSNQNLGQESPRFCLKFEKEKVHKSNEERNEGNHDDKNDSNVKREKAEFELNKETHPPETQNANHKFKNVEGDYDSWLKGVEINNEEDESFVRKISEAIRDLDAALALEKTSSSEEESGKSSHQNSPGKGVNDTEAKEVVVDFKLGSDVPSFMNFTQKSFELSSLQNSEQPQSLNFKNPYLNECKSELGEDNFEIKNYEFDESLKENDSLVGGQSRNSSDTDDEVWRKRIEKGEISEKVKEKSKSIANLMILTHIDASDDSDTDFDRPFDKNLNRSSFSRRSGSFAKSSLSSNIFGSENDLTNAVLAEDFKESLKKLSNDHKEYGRFDSLGMILPTLAGRENVWENLLKNSSPSCETSPASTTEVTPIAKPSKQTDDVNISNGDPYVKERAPLEPQDISETKEEDTLKNSNNFLGEVASEKQVDNNEELMVEGTTVDEDKSETQDGGSIDMEKSATSDYFSEKEDNVLQPKCDKTSSAYEDCSDSLKRNSSQLNEDSFVGNGSSEPTISFPQDESLEEEDIDEDGSGKNESFPDEKSDKFYLLEKINHSDAEVKPEDKSFETSSTASPSDSVKFVIKEKGNPLQIPEITVVEAGEQVEIPEETCQLPPPKMKPFKFVLKNDDLVPEIVVTEEPDIKSPEVEDEIVLNFEKKPFKFVLKDEKNGKTFSEPEDADKFKLDDVFNEKDGSFNQDLGDIRTVIMGPSEEFTLDYFKGLKTTSQDLEPDDKVHWNQHLEKALIQQVVGKDFDDICFESMEADSTPSLSGKPQLELNNKDVFCPVELITNFLEAERVHSDKMADSTNDEEYDHFKFRTPDDERSSDSGFRDKGSLSESVEDACEGKYNLEDIEAELEEAYVKGVFSNFDRDKESEAEAQTNKNSNNFEYEESKFYEDENKNEDDLSDIDGEIEFWQNKDGTDYYPEISEFNPTCSQGWYLHPPEEQSHTYHRNMNEDLMNALRNELRENLPVPCRSFSDFNDDFYESTFEEPKRELNIHYATDLSMPLSPIVEEHDPASAGTSGKKHGKNSFLETNYPNKIMKKSMVNLMESVKSIDTSTFMQYLDYMVENEGKGLDDLDEIEKKQDLEEIEETFCQEGSTDKNMDALNEQIEKSAEENPKSETDELFLDVERLKDSILEENLEVDDALLSPDVLSPDRERSLSDLSRSSNGTRTGDALSEITLSSPDLVPDCFLNGGVNGETPDVAEGTDDASSSATFFTAHDSKTQNEIFLRNERKHGTNETNEKVEEDNSERTELSESEVKFSSVAEENDLYEMSTSFMGADDDYEEDKDHKQQNIEVDVSEEKADETSGKDGDELFTPDWDSDSSVADETSSSSGEFIWKDGDKISNLKAVKAGAYDVTNAIFNESPMSKNDAETTATDQVEGESLIDDFEIEAVNSKPNENVNNDKDDDDDDEDDNESSTGSSASITDFVPSAWNSQAVPGRSALRNTHEDSSREYQPKKKNVWFKKQKYHCVYEYPREPSDTEDADSFNQLNSLDNSSKHFTFGVSTVELPNKHFPYGISNVIGYSSCNDWDLLEGPDGDLSLTDTDSDTGLGKSGTGNSSGKDSDFNFYNLSPFDYDFNSAGGSEFFVSSSSRPFQGGSTFSVFDTANGQTSLENIEKNDSAESDEASDSRDFTTPDSGLEDSANASPLEKKPGSESPGSTILSNAVEPGKVSDVLDSLKFNFSPEVVEEEMSKLTAADRKSEKTMPNEQCGSPASPLPPSGLGELRHARDRLKLDLPFNHNADLGAMRAGKKSNKIH